MEKAIEELRSEHSADYNRAVEQYETEEMEGCVEACEALMEKAGGYLTRHLRIRTLILTSAATGDDSDQAEKYRVSL